MQTGVLARGALICSTYKKGVMLTPKARTSYPNSLLMNYVSSDVWLRSTLYGVASLLILPVDF